MSDRLVADVRALIDEAAGALDPAVRPRLDVAAARLDGPLRVAIAGTVKAGKSTLLNALVGEEIAATDAGECTTLVTWYRRGPRYDVSAVPFEGPSSPLPYRRGDGALAIDLGTWRAADVHHLDVAWPTSRLEELVLIDTPGLASISTEVSARSEAFLTADRGSPGEADAVIYLLRHVHPSDVDFLEAFRDVQLAPGTSINALGILSRADEVGGCRVGAMADAATVAARHRLDPRLRRLCQVILPVAGLLAQGAAALRESELATLRTIAGADLPDQRDLLLSAARVLAPGTPLGLDVAARTAVMDRLGLFGVRLSVELLRAHRVATTRELADELVRRSGIAELREVLRSQFAARSRVLKARTALATVEALARRQGGAAGRRVLERVRDIQLAAHEFTEIALLQALRSGTIDITGLDGPAAERLLGGDGAEPWRRLGLDPAAPPAEVAAAAVAAVDRWRRDAEHPLRNRAARDLAGAVVRSCEGLLAAAATARAEAAAGGVAGLAVGGSP